MRLRRWLFVKAGEFASITMSIYRALRPSGLRLYRSPALSNKNG